jgi:hypothetical protein
MNKVDKKVLKYLDSARNIVDKINRKTGNSLTRSNEMEIGHLFIGVIEIAKMIQVEEVKIDESK